MIKNCSAFLFCTFMLYMASATAQESSGLMFPNRLGISVQKKPGIDIGLISFNQFESRSPMRYYDVSLGVESFLAKPFIMAPKLSFDFGVGDFVMFGGGVDVSRPTDFSRSTWMLTPKVGVSLASFIRLYYGYHIFEKDNDFPNFGRHRVSLEINIATLHDFSIGL